MSAAKDFLDAWTLSRTDMRPLSRDEAGEIAEQWSAEAADNDIDPDALLAAADGDLIAYLLRTYGEAGAEFTTDDGDHAGDQIHPPARDGDSPIGLFS